MDEKEPGRNGLVPIPERGLAKRDARSIFRRGLNRANDRVFKFPEHERLGTVYLRRVEAPEWNDTFRIGMSNALGVGLVPGKSLLAWWQEHAEARGEVAIPADRDVCLVLDPIKAEKVDWKFFLDLPSDLISTLVTCEHFDYSTIEHFTGLKALSPKVYGNCGLDDDSIKRISKIKNLCFLSIGLRDWDESTLTAEGLTPLLDMSDLMHLSMENTFVLRKPFSALGMLKNLRSLTLGNFRWIDKAHQGRAINRVNDCDLEMLENLEALENLSLESSAITSSGIERLNNLKNLRGLNCSRTNITNDPDPKSFFDGLDWMIADDTWYEDNVEKSKGNCSFGEDFYISVNDTSYKVFTKGEGVPAVNRIVWDRKDNQVVSLSWSDDPELLYKVGHIDQNGIRYHDSMVRWDGESSIRIGVFVHWDRVFVDMLVPNGMDVSVQQKMPYSRYWKYKAQEC